MKAVGIFCTTCAVMALSAVITGLVLSVLWGWFMAPLFGLPVITVAQAIGLWWVAVIIVPGRRSSKKTEQTAEEVTEEMLGDFARGTAFRLFVLLAGYLTHLAMVST